MSQPATCSLSGAKLETSPKARKPRPGSPRQALLEQKRAVPNALHKQHFAQYLVCRSEQNLLILRESYSGFLRWMSQTLSFTLGGEEDAMGFVQEGFVAVFSRAQEL